MLSNALVAVNAKIDSFTWPRGNLKIQKLYYVKSDEESRKIKVYPAIGKQLETVFQFVSIWMAK